MFPDYTYKWIYVSIVLVLTLIEVRSRRSPYEKESPVPSLVLAVILILFIAGRPHSFRYFGDTYNYSHWWGQYQWSGIKWDAENVLFDSLQANMALMGMTCTDFFYVIATIYFMAMWVACRKLFPNHTMLGYLICLGAFSTFSYGTNGIKAGAAASLFLVALAYRDKLWISLIFLALARGFHHSMTMSVVAYALTLYFRNSKWYFYGWLFCLAMAAAHVSYFQTLFSSMTDDSGNAYLTTSSTEDWGGKSGFRADFVLYSSMPILFGHYVINKFQLRDDLYEKMLHLYITTNAVWMLCMYGHFTNRIAYLSWQIYPMLIAYPCLQVEDQTHPLLQYRNNVIMAHLAFTLFAAFFLF